MNEFVWKHEFDTDNMGAAERHEIIMRYHDLVRFCENYPQCEYSISEQFDPRGIVCEFELESDIERLYQFTSDYWIHLHD